MKTRQSTGYFQQVYVRLLLCFISSVVFAGSAFAFTLPGGPITACYDCHGSFTEPVTSSDNRPIDSAYRNITTGGFIGSHRKHMPTQDYTATFPTTICSPCHGVAPTTMNHRNGLINFTSNINNSTPPGTYSKGRFFNQTSLPVLGTCSNVNCHASAYSTATVTSPAWGVAAGCAACHIGGGAFTGTGTAPATGSHDAHMALGGSACNQCHNGAVAGSSGGTAHADGNIDVTQSYPPNVVKHTAGTYTGTCSTTCHSPTTSPVTTPTWGSALTCSSCHAASPATGSHIKHLSGLAVNFNRNALCADCHIGAIINSNGGTGHGDGDIDVTGGYPANKLKGSAVGACTTSSCHSNGAAVTAYKSANWGATNTAGCNFCHDALPTTGSHSIHLAGGTNYSFGCAECHGHNGTGTAHNDGVINVPGIGYNVSKQCATSDCHSNGKAAVVYALSPAWGGAFTGDRCAACHGNWPTGDAHVAHQVGIHYDDIYNRTGGKIAASATVASAINAGHGNTLYSTTISCNMCHSTVVSVNYNDKATTCGTATFCHAVGGAGGLKGSLTTASLNKTLHVNRVREVSFAASTIRSKAQIRDDITTVPELNNFWTRTNLYKTGANSHDVSKATLSATASYAAGTCSAVVCHNGVSVNWTAGAISCDKCHTALP
jgi:predicted CxxxxCH...CXXCH cytochrome family protein